MSLFLPCLLERWERWVGDGSPRAIESTWDDVRRDVTRNLEWLFNTEARDWTGPLDPERRIALPDEAVKSVIAFGIPTYSGRAQAPLKPAQIAENIKKSVLAFEPRIDEISLEVHPMDGDAVSQFNTLRFRVQGYLRANPLIPFEAHTEIDMETGQGRLLD